MNLEIDRTFNGDYDCQLLDEIPTGTRISHYLPEQPTWVGLDGIFLRISPRDRLPWIGLFSSVKTYRGAPYCKLFTPNTNGIYVFSSGDMVSGLTLSVVSETTATRFKPFFCKSVNEIDNMFKVKGFQLKGPDPISGRGNYVSPSGRGFHLDANHPPGKLPHVGVHRPREYRGPLVTRDFFIRR